MAGRGTAFRVALCVPMSGRAGIWGPSCLASAELAARELNAEAGLAGRPCELLTVDASDDAVSLGDTLSDAIDDGDIDAIVGMHMSSVRQRIAAAVGGRLPYVYTAPYEGGESTPRVYAIGETSAAQLRPSIDWLATHRRCRRWLLVGNDSVWPRVSHAIARTCIAQSGGVVAAEAIVAFGSADHSPVFEALRANRCDAVLISMVGQDAVEFNRAFARAGLQRHALRLSCAIEENQLLAIGAEACEGLHVALGYFASLDTEANAFFRERYHGCHGPRAPTLNSLGQSLYEGLHFLDALLRDRHRSRPSRDAAGLVYRSARGSTQPRTSVCQTAMYLAQADGHLFRVLTRL